MSAQPQAAAEAPPHPIAVIYDGGWKIQYRDNRFGPYGSRAEAVARATMWFDDARRRGHPVALALHPQAEPRGNDVPTKENAL